MADDPNYETLKALLLSKGTLYEDPDFPASDLSIKNNAIIPSSIVWKRPKVGRHRCSRARQV